MSLAVVRDLREVRSAAGPAELGKPASGSSSLGCSCSPPARSPSR